MKFKNDKEKEIYQSAFSASKAGEYSARKQDAERAVLDFRANKNKKAETVRSLIKKRHEKMKDDT